MSERERMEAGALYRFAGDAELMAMGARSRRLARQYNATREDEGDRRRALRARRSGRSASAASTEAFDPASERSWLSARRARTAWGSSSER